MDAECKNCGRLCDLREDAEPTEFCDECAQEELVRLAKAFRGMEEALSRLGDAITHAGRIAEELQATLDEAKFKQDEEV